MMDMNVQRRAPQGGAREIMAHHGVSVFIESRAENGLLFDDASVAISVSTDM